MLSFDIFSDHAFNRKILRLALPITFQGLVGSLVAASDAVMLGSINQDAMAGVSLAMHVPFVQSMLLYAATSALGILGAQYWGKNNRDAIEFIFRTVAVVAAVTAGAFALLCYFTPHALMRCFASEGPLVETGARYLKLTAPAYFLSGLSQCYHSTLKFSGHVPESAGIGIFMVILNVMLNAAYIYGFDMGVDGAAIATLTTAIAGFFLVFSASLKPNHIRLTTRRINVNGKLLVADLAKCAWPLFGASFVYSIGFTTYSAIMGHLGSDAAAANSMTAVVRNLVCCVTNGIATAAGIAVGNELGAGHLNTGKKYGDRLTAMSVMLGLISALIVLVATNPVAASVKLSPVARDYFTGMMYVMAVYMLGRSISGITINGIFTAGGDTLFNAYSLAVCMWGVAIPLALLGAFVFHWPVVLVFACICIDEVGKVPWVFHHYFKYKWVKDLTR